MNRKGIMGLILTCLIAFFVMLGVACKPTSNSGDSSSKTESSITLSKNSVTLPLLETITLTANGTNTEDDYIWSVSGDTILILSAEGNTAVVRAVAQGKTTVTVSVGERSDSCEITVVAPNEVPLLVGVSDDLAILAGNTFTLTPQVTFKGENVAEVTYEYVSSNTGIVEVSNNGVLSGKALGTATITIKANYYNYEMRKDLSVTVRENVAISLVCDTQEIYLANPDEDESIKTSANLHAVVIENAINVTESAIVEYSFDSDIISLDEEGIVMPVKTGTATITASWESPSGTIVQDTITITVKKANVVREGYAEIDRGGAATLDLSGYEGLPNETFKVTDITLGEAFETVRNENLLELDGTKLGYGERTLVLETNQACYTIKAMAYNKIITTAEELLNFLEYADKVVEYTWMPWGFTNDSVKDYTGICYEGHFKLGANINLGSEVVSARGSFNYQSDGGLSAGFKGVFDGDGYIITGGVYGLGGLFGCVSTEGIIKNVAFKNVKLYAESYDAGWGKMESVAVFGTGFNGTASDVLVEIVDDGNSKYGGVFGSYICGATLENVVVYYPENKIETNGSKPLSAFGFQGNVKTVNIIVFTDTTYENLPSGVSVYAYDTELSDITLPELDTALWNVSEETLKFVKEPKIINLAQTFEYEKYIGSSINVVGGENIFTPTLNTTDFVLDLTSYENITAFESGALTAEFISQTYTFSFNEVSLENKKLTFTTSDIQSIYGGAYILVLTDSEGTSQLHIPVNIINRVITNSEDLINMLKYCDNVRTLEWTFNGGAQSGVAYDGYFKLGKNIDMTGYGAIANSGNGAGVYYGGAEYSDYIGSLHGFNGVFDGDGYTISNATFTAGGLFGFVSRNATIKNVAIVNGTLNSDGGNYPGVLGTGVFGRIENVLIDVDASNSNYGNLAGYGMRYATLKNVIIYFKAPATGFETNLDGPWHDVGDNETENVHIFTGLTMNSPLTGKYAYDATISTAVAAGTFDKAAFDTTIWNLSGDKAVFAKVPKTLIVTNVYDYEKYTGLNDTQKILNVDNLVIDLASATEKEENELFIPQNATYTIAGNTLVGVTIDGLKITIPASQINHLAGGEYLLTITAKDYSLSIPITIWNKIIMQEDDLINMLKYADYLETKSWVFNGTTYSADALQGYFKLGKNLDMTGKVLANDGSQGGNVYYANSNSEGNNGYLGTLTGFNGVFDGDGYTISNATFTAGGLFGFVSRNATIKNVAIVNGTLNSDGGNYPGVLGTGVFGRIENVLIDVDASNSNYGNLAGYGMRFATLKNVIIYFKAPTTGFETNLEGAWTGMGENTVDNVQVFTGVNVVSGVTGKYAYDTTLEEAVAAGAFDKTKFDSTIWDLSGDEAAFVAKTE